MAEFDSLTISGSRDVLAQLIVPTLHRQRWSLDGSTSATLGRVIHLSAGRAELSHANGTLALRSPDVVWLPAGDGRSLRVEPGSAGTIVGVSESMLAAAIGHHADSNSLRRLTGRLCHLSAHEPRARQEMERSLRAVEADARQAAGGSWHYQAAHVTIVLVLLWRLAGSDLPSPARLGAAADRLRRFRQLVEVHFREHWTVARYAAELSISPDRLHDQCARRLGRTPIALVHQRLAHEARLLVGGSDQTIERLALDLGFGSTSHFSRFFKRWASVAPMTYRERIRQLAATDRGGVPASYADWP